MRPAVPVEPLEQQLGPLLPGIDLERAGQQGLALLRFGPVLEVELAGDREVGRGGRPGSAVLAVLDPGLGRLLPLRLLVLQPAQELAGGGVALRQLQRLAQAFDRRSARANSWNRSRAFSASRSARTRLSVMTASSRSISSRQQLDVAALGVEGARSGQSGGQLHLDRRHPFRCAGEIAARASLFCGSSSSVDRAEETSVSIVSGSTPSGWPLPRPRQPKMLHDYRSSDTRFKSGKGADRKLFATRLVPRLRIHPGLRSPGGRCRLRSGDGPLCSRPLPWYETVAWPGRPPPSAWRLPHGIVSCPQRPPAPPSDLPPRLAPGTGAVRGARGLRERQTARPATLLPAGGDPGRGDTVQGRRRRGHRPSGRAEGDPARGPARSPSSATTSTPCSTPSTATP